MIERLENEVEMLNRHFAVLERVIEDEPIGIVRLSDELGYPKHKMRYSLRVLEEEDIIEPTDQGAVTTDEAPDFLDEHTDRLDGVIEQLDALQEPRTGV